MNNVSKGIYVIKGAWQGSTKGTCWLMREDGRGHSYNGKVTPVNNVWCITKTEFKDICESPEFFTLITENSLSPAIHVLKCWPEYFKAICSGEKTFECRKDDRNYKVGDTLILKEYDPDANTYSGKEYSVEISYKINGGNFGVYETYCVLGITPTKLPKDKKDISDEIRFPPAPIAWPGEEDYRIKVKEAGDTKEELNEALLKIQERLSIACFDLQAQVKERVDFIQKLNNELLAFRTDAYHENLKHL
jgi:hypothetical protein